MQFISPQIDFAFKRIFGNEQHKEVLISFINSVLDLSGERQVVEVELANPYQVPRARCITAPKPMLSSCRVA